MGHQTMSHLSFTKKMNFTKYGAIEKKYRTRELCIEHLFV